MHKNILIPQNLRKGDTVGIIAPSKSPRDNPVSNQATKNGISFLESLGLKVKFAPHVYDKELYYGALIENRVKDIHDMFLDEEVKMVLMAVGGSNVNLVLPHLDYDLIRACPKIFSGMSDGTLLVNAIYQKAGLQTYYGVNLNDAIGHDISEKMKENFIDTFFNNKPIILSENKSLNFTDWSSGNRIPHSYKGWNVIREGSAEGELVGGLVERLVVMDYEGFEIDYGNKILFIETVADLRYLIIYVSAMKQKGVFGKINGLVMGHCSNIENQQDVTEFLKWILQEYNFPIIQIGELGHNVENYSFPVGANAIISTKDKTIIITK